MSTHIKTYKFKLFPNKVQCETLSHYLSTTRFIYNLCLEYKIAAYRCNKTNISKNDIQKELKDIKNETEWMKDLHSQVIQDVTDRLFASYDNFFRRVKQGASEAGFPKFAKKDFWTSFKFKQGVKIRENTNKIVLPKIGPIKFVKSRDIKGAIKTASIKKEFDGWYVCITFEEETKHLSPNTSFIGIDLGIKDLAITSKGVVFNNPKTLIKWSDKLTECQRMLSRKIKGSNNRKKVKNRLKRLHAKVSRIRRDYLHKVSSQMVSDNQVIVCEKLSTKNMMQNHKLAKSISDASWSMLTSMIEYKAKWMGRTFIQVAPNYTSQDCNACGFRNKELTLSVREWICPDCKTSHDRDVNAAKNILNKGIAKLKEAGHVFYTSGDMVDTSLPAEEPSHTIT